MYFLSLLSLALSLASATPTPLSKRNAPQGVPSYVLDYAPIVYLYDSDPYRPSDIGNQLVNTRPELNFTSMNGVPSPMTLDNLNDMNDLDGENGTYVYLTSKQDPSTNPAWLKGVEPDSMGKTGSAVSCAIIVTDHGGGLVDAFYMYFYAFNFGGVYLGQTFGNHVGDWEHNMVRFQDGKPQAVWYSQHDNGEAFEYNILEKYQSGTRPVAYSATGSHANYATTGSHAHDIPDVNLPVGLRTDHCNKGPLWDPTLSAYYYSYDPDSLQFSAYDDSTPVNWLYYVGKWGDDQYPTSDPRQSCLFGSTSLPCKYNGGPTGPEDKQLDRQNVCPDDGYPCIVRSVLGL